MDTSTDRARSGHASAKARQGLTEAKLRDLQPRERPYKVADGGNGLYVVVSPSGSRSFRYDYRLGGRRETLTIGRHEPVARHAQRSHLAYGMDLTLEEARLLLARARVDVSSGRSPARAKVEQRSEVADALSFGRWATRYFEFKSDSKSGGERLADSTLALRKSIYNRILAGPFAKLNLNEIKPVALAELLDRVKSERGPGPAVHARELVLQVYRFATGKGVEVSNPAEALARKAYATFMPRERNLSRHEIKALLDALEQTGTAPTLRLAVRFMLLTGVRKGEFVGATWSEVDWERAQWLIPAERMKAGKSHTVYLAEQALDILTTLRTCFPSSKHLHPSRYDSVEPLSQATLNRTITAAVDRINEDRKPDQERFLPVSVHDLRRTFSSRLNDALFPEVLIEASLAHQKKDQVAAAYNHARLSGPRRALMQAWANMLDCWMRGETASQAVARGRAMIDEASSDEQDMDL
ncbi:site-specific integrase [Piscinibacter sp. HJYY11]|uniref:tyrosine-type recombinase/integrase n=1 Tax=Piscinibacter sp. HJYY11 TaxID=2801333 RepID=UPI00191F8397|nr:site-specific integrase [Piscinibacter sp. HJYY11]MBL0731198.1 tyrosine-type recombinase/integrase [Piscinibacter sp. HJYY11]